MSNINFEEQMKKELENNPKLKKTLGAMLEAINGGKPGVHMVEYFHDNWCPKSKGTGECICDPNMKVKEIKDE